VANLIGGWHQLELSSETRNILSKSIRPGTHKLYELKWRTWSQWCSNQSINRFDPTTSQFLDFLTYLATDLRLATSTVATYKSAVLGLISHSASNSIIASGLVTRFIKGLAAIRPTVVTPPVWIRDDVLDDLRRFPPTRNSPYEVGRHLALLVLLYSGRRISDLVLLRVDTASCVFTADSVVLQAHFGSKTDGHGRNHRFIQSKIGFRSHEQWGLDVPRVLRHYIELTKTWRGDSTALFISCRIHHRPATAQAIGSWVRRRLEMAGVTAATPGSTRSATATAATLQGTSLAHVLRNGNWRSKSVFLRHYFRP